MILSKQPTIAQVERLLARWPDCVRLLPDGRVEVDVAEEETLAAIASSLDGDVILVDADVGGRPIENGVVELAIEEVRTEVPPPPANGLAPVRQGQGDVEPRKRHYGDGVQPWDVIVANGWGPIFAASNVLKYLRRTKNAEHSLESARWYYDRLVDGAAGAIAAHPYAFDWQRALDRLELSLTRSEIATVRQRP